MFFTDSAHSKAKRRGFCRNTLSNLLVHFRLIELGSWPHDWVPRFSLGLKKCKQRFVIQNNLHTVAVYLLDISRCGEKSYRKNSEKLSRKGRYGVSQITTWQIKLFLAGELRLSFTCQHDIMDGRLLVRVGLVDLIESSTAKNERKSRRN